MAIYLSHASAQTLWRRPESTALADRRLSTRQLDDCPRSKLELSDSLEAGSKTLVNLSRPLDLMVPDPRLRIQNPDIVYHVWMRGTPAKSLAPIQDEVYISSPEFTYLQMATVITVPRLIEYGMELCGAYAKNSSVAGFCKHTSLTSVAELNSYLKSAPGTRGVSIAKKATQYVVDNSRSPGETAVVILLCVSPRLGGYGLRLPQMNSRIDLPQHWAHLLKTPYLLVDLLWEDAHVIIEYDSNLAHTLGATRDHDDDRKSALEELGYTVISLRAPRLMDPRRFDEMVRHRLAPILDERLPKQSKLFWQRQMDLRNQILRTKSR